MNARDKTEEAYFEMPESIDMIAIERRARELRAEAFADGVRALTRAILRRAAAFRATAASRTA